MVAKAGLLEVFLRSAKLHVAIPGEVPAECCGAQKTLDAVMIAKAVDESLGKAAELVGLPVGQMMTILTEFGVESRLEKEDYLQECSEDVVAVV